VLKTHSHNSDADKSDDPPDKRSSLDRLADFTRRIVSVPKGDIARAHQRPTKKHRTRRQKT
jgi:hypothetical protein